MRATRRSTPLLVAAERTGCHRRPICVDGNKAPAGGDTPLCFVCRAQKKYCGGRARLLRRAARKVERAPKGKTPAVCTAQSRRDAALRNGHPATVLSVRWNLAEAGKLRRRSCHRRSARNGGERKR